MEKQKLIETLKEENLYPPTCLLCLKLTFNWTYKNGSSYRIGYCYKKGQHKEIEWVNLFKPKECFETKGVLPKLHVDCQTFQTDKEMIDGTPPYHGWIAAIQSRHAMGVSVRYNQKLDVLYIPCLNAHIPIHVGNGNRWLDKKIKQVINEYGNPSGKDISQMQFRLVWYANKRYALVPYWATENKKIRTRTAMTNLAKRSPLQLTAGYGEKESFTEWLWDYTWKKYKSTPKHQQKYIEQASIFPNIFQLANMYSIFNAKKPLHKKKKVTFKTSPSNMSLSDFLSAGLNPSEKKENKIYMEVAPMKNHPNTPVWKIEKQGSYAVLEDGQSSPMQYARPEGYPSFLQLRYQGKGPMLRIQFRRGHEQVREREKYISIDFPADLLIQLLDVAETIRPENAAKEAEMAGASENYLKSILIKQLKAGGIKLPKDFDIKSLEGKQLDINSLLKGKVAPEEIQEVVDSVAKENVKSKSTQDSIKQTKAVASKAKTKAKPKAKLPPSKNN